jgi:hypothetical protein
MSFMAPPSAALRSGAAFRAGRGRTAPAPAELIMPQAILPSGSRATGRRGPEEPHPAENVRKDRAQAHSEHAAVAADKGVLANDPHRQCGGGAGASRSRARCVLIFERRSGFGIEYARAGSD